MSKHLPFPAAIFSVACQRCGNRLQRDERWCSQCGAFRAVMSDDAHGGQIDHDPAPLTVVEGPWPVRDAPDATTPEEVGRYLVRSVQSPAPVPLLKRTLSVRTAILGACVVGAIACGLTYLLYGVTHESADSSQEISSANNGDSAPNTDAAADVSYMNPKALREIDAQLGGTTSTSGPPPALDDQEPSDAVPPAPPPHASDNLVAPPPTTAQPGTMTTGIIQKALQNPTAAPAIRPVSPPQTAALNPTFPDARDPDALERAILQYGWKTPAAAKSSQ